MALHILLALADRDRHGLGIAEEVEAFTSGRVTLGPGTLYGTIKRLLELALIEERAGAPREDRDDPRRRYYRITASGRITAWLLAAPWLAAMLFGVEPTDLVTLAGVAALILSVAVAASALPARRAARVDPVVALRAE